MLMFSEGGHMYTSAAEEKAARLKIERNRDFKATHTYDPVPMDQFDLRGVQGSPLTPGSPVQLLREATRGLHTGMPAAAKKMFNVVRDAQGNIAHVHKNSLGPLRKSSGESE